MIAVAAILAHVASESGISMPEDIDEYNPKDYPHWHVYSTIQFGAPMPTPTAHYDNAKIIAGLDYKKVIKLSPKDFDSVGIRVGYSK